MPPTPCHIRFTAHRIPSVTGFAALAISACAWSQPPIPPAPSATAPILEQPPDDIRAILVLHQGSQRRVHAPTKRLLDLLSAAGNLDAKSAAWSGLATTLGVQEGAAFDSLLGERVVAVIATRAREERSRWALVSHVSPAAADELERKLDPAPRGVENGNAIMLLEQGKFRLTRIRASPGLDPNRSHLLLLTPTNADLGVDLALKCCTVAPQGPSDSKPAVQAFFRLASPDTTVRPWGAASLRETENGWTTHFTSSPEMFALSPARCSALASAELPPTPSLSPPHVLLEVWGTLPLELSSMYSSQARVSLALLSFLKLPLPDPANLGPRVLVRLESLAGGVAERPGHGRSSIALTIGIEVSDVDKASKQGDETISALLKRNESGKGGRGGDAERVSTPQGQIRAVAEDPSAIRVASLRSRPAPDQAEVPNTLCWTYARAGTPSKDTSSRGWWLIQFRPGQDARDETELSLRLLAKEVVPDRNLLLSIVARPAALSRLLEESSENEVGIPALVRAFELIEFSARATSRGLVEGVGSFTLTPPAQPPPPPSAPVPR
jgi:hypothetical protein